MKTKIPLALLLTTHLTLQTNACVIDEHLLNANYQPILNHIAEKVTENGYKAIKNPRPSDTDVANFINTPEFTTFAGEAEKKGIDLSPYQHSAAIQVSPSAPLTLRPEELSGRSHIIEFTGTKSEKTASYISLINYLKASFPEQLTIFSDFSGIIDNEKKGNDLEGSMAILDTYTDVPTVILSNGSNFARNETGKNNWYPQMISSAEPFYLPHQTLNPYPVTGLTSVETTNKEGKPFTYHVKEFNGKDIAITDVRLGDIWEPAKVDGEIKLRYPNLADERVQIFCNLEDVQNQNMDPFYIDKFKSSILYFYGSKIAGFTTTSDIHHRGLTEMVINDEDFKTLFPSTAGFTAQNLSIAKSLIYGFPNKANMLPYLLNILEESNSISMSDKILVFIDDNITKVQPFAATADKLIQQKLIKGAVCCVLALK